MAQWRGNTTAYLFLLVFNWLLLALKINPLVGAASNLLPTLVQFSLTLPPIISKIPFKKGDKNNIVHFPSDVDPMTIHEHFMDMALNEAQRAFTMNEVPIGAIIVRKTPPQHDENNNSRGCSYEVLSKSHNLVEHSHDASSHAEMNALRYASSHIQNWRLINSTLYSTLEPCPMCLAAAQAFRIGQVVYGANDLRLGAVETHMNLLEAKHPYHELEALGGIRAVESELLMKDFFRRRREENKVAKKRRRRKQLLLVDDEDSETTDRDSSMIGRIRKILSRLLILRIGRK